MTFKCEAVAVRRTWVYDPAGETHRWIDRPHRCERNAVERGLCWQHGRLDEMSTESLRRVSDLRAELGFADAPVMSGRPVRPNGLRAARV